MTQAPIAVLQRDLVAELANDARGSPAHDACASRVAHVLAAYAAAHDDWRRFAMFDAEVYTRNLVGRNEHFEMLVLCWSAGQASPIHNHAGQQCWMAVLDGEIEEIQYSSPPAGEAGPLVQGARRVLRPGKVGYIDDEIALHRVRPTPGHRGVSLHLYARPIDVCNVYDEATGRVVPSRLVYHSIEGVRTGAAPAARLDPLGRHG